MVRVINVDTQGFLYLVTRGEWLAREPTRRSPVTRPFHKISLTVTHTPECCNRSDCVMLLRRIQDQHMAEGSPDIRPSFLIGGYGTVYEGRGWADQTEYEVFNTCKLEIAFIGDFATNSATLKPPPYEMFSSALTLIKFGLKSGFIRQDFRMSYTFPKAGADPGVLNTTLNQASLFQ